MARRSNTLLRGLPILATLAALAAPTVAVTPLDRTDGMAAQAGDVLGAAAGCGVPDTRLTPVSIAGVDLIRMTGVSPSEMRKARSVFEYMAARATARTRADQSLCPAALATFEQAWRNR